MLHHGAKNADNIYRGSTSLGSEVDLLVGMAASPINANARALSPVGRVEGLEGFVVVSDKQTHEWTRVGQHEIRDALETKDEDLERAIIKVATAAGPTFKSQFRTRLRDGGVHVRATDVDAMVLRIGLAPVTAYMRDVSEKWVSLLHLRGGGGYCMTAS